MSGHQADLVAMMLGIKAPPGALANPDRTPDAGHDTRIRGYNKAAPGPL